MLGFLNRKFLFSVLGIFILTLVFFCFKFKIELSAEFAKAVNQSQFYFASLTSLPQKNVDLGVETQDNNLLQPENLENEIIEPVLVEASSEDELDDLAEQIDIIKRQINDLIESRKPKIDEKEKLTEDEKIEEEKVEEKLDDQTEPFYPQILISEVQVAGQNDDKQEFVELYNPSDMPVDLTNWYLQRKTKTAESFSTYVSSSLFLNKIIYPKSYFLIARSSSFFASYADILTENPLTLDNSLVLKNPNKDISDLLGFGQANEFWGNVAENPPSGKTIGRKWVNSEVQNIGSNNLDFEIQIPTPKQQNRKFIETITAPATGTGGSGNTLIIYPKILLSEVKIAEKTGDKDVYIELYNPSNNEVDLTNWYMFRNDTSFITKPIFAGKKIPASGYFLLTKQGSKWDNISDLIFDNTLNEDDKITFKNPNQDVSDEISWSKIVSSQSYGRKWSENLEQDFEIQVPTPKMQNTTFVEPPIIEIPKDTTSPSVTFEVMPAVQTSLNFPISFEISDLDLLGTVTPSGMDGFVFRWTDADPLVAENWHNDEAKEIDGHPMSIQLTKQSETIPVADGKTYYFQVKAKDKEGNWSEFLPANPIFIKIELPLPPPPVVLLPIVINEIQIEGEKTSHDFIEIYNPNDSEILLDEYRLVKRAKTSVSDTTIKSWGAEDKILAKQYYLWASSTDENYPNIIGANIFTKQNISDNNGVAIRKGSENIGEIIDAVGWGEFTNVLFEGSVFLTNPEKNKSISRILGADTNDNSKDFITLNTPTPKAE